VLTVLVLNLEMWQTNQAMYTVSQKNVPPSTCCNIDIRDLIMIIFGRNVTGKVKNYMMLCFPTLPV